MKTPDNTVIFVTPGKADEILTDQINCMGCLSACGFSNWAQNDAGTTGKKADPRSLLHPEDAAEHLPFRRRADQLMFAGHTPSLPGRSVSIRMASSDGRPACRTDCDGRLSTRSPLQPGLSILTKRRRILSV